jgi:arylsulfatase
MPTPNVLLICTDHWSGRLLGCAGHPAVLTPTLDQLAANGVRYSNAYSAAPSCIPARRAIMTGLTPRSHGDRVFNETRPMPAAPTLAGTFAAAGYQAFAVGKLHVYPQRDRIGFHDVILHEEGRQHLGLKADDYEQYVADQGYAGQQYTHGMSANGYMVRPWHLPERLHSTAWTVHETCRAIKRRDPTRPAFWYMSFQFPHPPLVPPRDYLEMYRDAEIPGAIMGEWVRDPLPYYFQQNNDFYPTLSDRDLRMARAAFYAQCTFIDHQMRLVVGMLREEGLLDNTIIAFTADHGDMLGSHGLFEKSVFYEDSAKVPLIIVPTAEYSQMGHHMVDDRLVELRDIMPTLLELAGISIPNTVEGMSLVGARHRDWLYGEHMEDERATRMVHDGRYKLIYYAVGNRRQLFDLLDDPDELHDLAGEPAQGTRMEQMTALLVSQFYGSDLSWLRDGQLVGQPAPMHTSQPNRGLSGQRGWRFIDPPGGTRY